MNRLMYKITIKQKKKHLFLFSQTQFRAVNLFTLPLLIRDNAIYQTLYQLFAFKTAQIAQKYIKVPKEGNFIYFCKYMFILNFALQFLSIIEKSINCAF